MVELNIRRVKSHTTPETNQVSVIEELLALQNHDEIIRGLEGPIQDIPNRISQEIRKAETEAAYLAKAENEVRRLILAVRDNELEISATKDRIQRIKIESASVKKVETFNIIKRDLEENERRISSLTAKDTDDRMLLDGAQKYAAECAAKLAEVSETVNAYTAELKAKLADKTARLEQAKTARLELVKPFATPATRRFLAYYERIATKRWPVLIEVSPNNVCSGCHMNLPPSKLQEANKNSMVADNPVKMTVVACDYCGRMLYK